MSLKHKITEIALRKLGTRIPPHDSSWSDVRPIAHLYGEDAVIEAFSDFCEDHQGEQMHYPLGQFIRIADGLITGSTIRNEAVNLATKLAVIAGDPRITFGSKEIAGIGRLLSVYPEEGIEAAFREFLPTLEDAYSIKNGTKNFVERAPQLIAQLKGRTAASKLTATG
jgi:hypothetical protein